MVDLPGISYLRTTREKTPVFYAPARRSPSAAAARVVTDQDRVAVIAAGITVHEASKAYDALKAEGIEIRIIDAYSVKPIDKKTLQETVAAVGGKLVTVEDHWPRAAWATPCWTRWRRSRSTACAWSSWPCATCPAPARRPNCSTPPASTRTLLRG